MRACRRRSKSLPKGEARVLPRVAHRLTPVSRYTDAVERHFRESVLEALPARYDSLLQQIEDNQAGSAYDMGASRVPSSGNCSVLLTPARLQYRSPTSTATCSVACWRTKATLKSTSALPHAALGSGCWLTRLLQGQKRRAHRERPAHHPLQTYTPFCGGGKRAAGVEHEPLRQASSPGVVATRASLCRTCIGELSVLRPSERHPPRQKA